jgi:hypothetical protein
LVVELSHDCFKQTLKLHFDKAVLLLPKASYGSILGWPKAAANGSFVGLANEMKISLANENFSQDKHHLLCYCKFWQINFVY